MGVRYFENQFRIQGITPAQQEAILRDQMNIYTDKVQQLWVNDVSERMNQPNADPASILKGMDRFLLAYANIAVSTAFDVVLNSITGLNMLLGRKYSFVDAAFPQNPVSVRWVLRETAEHSLQCLALAKGEDGTGVWDSKLLIENKLFPGSPRLDCGGNCRCTIVPIVTTGENIGFIQNLLNVGYQKTSLRVLPDMTPQAFKDLMIAKRYEIPDSLLEDWSQADYLRRTEFWSSLPALRRNSKGQLVGGVQIEVAQGEQFMVGGWTDIIKEKGKVYPGAVTLKITLGPDDTLDKLGALQLMRIKEALSHELAHVTAYVDPQGYFRSAFLKGNQVKDLLEMAAAERAHAIEKLSIDFEKVVNNIPSTDLARPDIQDTIKIMREFLANAEDFGDRLNLAVTRGETFGGMPARDAYNLVIKLINQFSPNSFVLSPYQLIDAEEFWAEWFSKLLTMPDKAAMYSPSLNRIVSNTLNFFETAITKRSKTLLPDAASVLFRSDLPITTQYEPLIPRLTFKNASDAFKIDTRILTKTALNKQLQEIFDNAPSLMRDEFFKDLNVRFISRTAMGPMTGSRNNLGFFEDGIFYINASIWKTLSVEQRTSTLADIISNHVWQSQGSIRTTVRRMYTNYVVNMLRTLEFKFGQTSLDNEPIRAILGTIGGTQLSEGKNLPRNISFWIRNFNDFKPFIKNVSDLPILDLDSLASPQMFLRSWFRMYITHPSVAIYYNSDLVSLIRDYLSITKVE